MHISNLTNITNMLTVSLYLITLLEAQPPLLETTSQISIRCTAKLLNLNQTVNIVRLNQWVEIRGIIKCMDNNINSNSSSVLAEA